MLRSLILSASLGFTGYALAACEVRLKHPVRDCPAVTYGPEDCFDTMSGTTGDRITSPATAHIMENGRTYYCPSHEACIEMKDLNFNGCVFTHVPRQPGESKGYEGHIVVDDKPFKTRK